MTRHVVVVADARFPIREPFAGGMQALTWHLVKGLRARGVAVTVFAGPGSDPALGANVLDRAPLQLSDAARHDVSMPPDEWMAQHHAYLDLMLAMSRRHDVDVVHNNSLHHLPIALASLVESPVLTTLHTPPTPWIESAVRLSGGGRTRFVAVSRHTSEAWQRAAGLTAPVVPNGVDVDAWPLGSGGDALVWSGRVAPEKAPHLAVEIARAAGRPLRLAGPLSDPAYWDREVRPRLGPDVRYEGHLAQQDLARLVGASAACLVTPVWDEPYCLVAAEALACGTPVLGFAQGGLQELIGPDSGRLVPAGDLAAAVALLPDVIALDRRTVRRHAVRHCSLDAMVEGYRQLYDELCATGDPAA